MPAPVWQLQNHQPKQVSFHTSARPVCLMTVIKYSLMSSQAQTPIGRQLNLVHHANAMHAQLLYGPATAACRTVSDIIPKEKSNGLPVFTQALRLVPFTMPDHWSGPRLCEDLPGDALHSSHYLQPCLTASSP